MSKINLLPFVLFPRFKKDVCPEPDITDPIYDDRVFMKLYYYKVVRGTP
jgi:hypothetical protein